MSISGNFDLLISSSSWEARSTSAVQRLSPTFFSSHALIYKYTHNSDTQGTEYQEVNHRIIINSLQQSGCVTASVTTDLWSPETAIRHLDLYLKATFNRCSKLRIIFDITTFTKADTLVFLKYLDEAPKQNDITLFFTDLAQPQTGQASRGIEAVMALPLYGGKYTQGKDNLLIIFLGFEPDRVIGLWEKLEPQRTIPLYSIRRDGESPLKVTAFRDRFLNRPGIETPIEVTSKPLELAGRMATIFSAHEDKYNIAVAATGNKFQCLGIYMFTKIYGARSQLFYPIPEQYTKKYWNFRRIAPDSVQIRLSEGCRVSRLPTK